jgi:hypothetical protein
VSKPPTNKLDYGRPEPPARRPLYRSIWTSPGIGIVAGIIAAVLFGMVVYLMWSYPTDW